MRRQQRDEERGPHHTRKQQGPPEPRDRLLAPGPRDPQGPWDHKIRQRVHPDHRGLRSHALKKWFFSLFNFLSFCFFMN